MTTTSMRPLRIAIPTRFVHGVGGVETYLEGVLPALLSRGHTLKLWHEFDRPPGVASLVPQTVDVGRLGPTPEAALGAVADIAAWKPDVIFSQGLSRLDSEQRLLPLAPLVVVLHAYHGTCISGHKMHGVPTPRPCTRTLGPGCLVRFHARRCGGLSPLTMVRDFVEQRGRQVLLTRAHAVAALSEHMRQEAIAHGVDERRAFRVPAFAPALPDGPSRAVTVRSPDGQHVVFAGRMDPLKGALVFVEALGRLPPSVRASLRVTIVGDGRERTACEQAVARLENDSPQVRVTGWVSRASWAGILRDADLLVVPSLWPEPLGLVGLEAASLGVPALAFDSGGIRDWLVDDETGRLVSGDPSSETLAAALMDCLGEPERLTRWGQTAAGIARARTTAAHVMSLEQVFQSAMVGRDGPRDARSA